LMRLAPVVGSSDIKSPSLGKWKLQGAPH